MTTSKALCYVKEASDIIYVPHQKIELATIKASLFFYDQLINEDLIKTLEQFQLLIDKCRNFLQNVEQFIYQLKILHIDFTRLLSQIFFCLTFLLFSENIFIYVDKLATLMDFINVKGIFLCQDRKLKNKLTYY